MDPVSVTVAAMVAASFKSVGEQAGRGAWGVLGRAVEAVRARLSDDEAGGRALAALEQAPDDEACVAALSGALERRAGADAVFRGELAALVNEARRDPVAGRIVTEVYGNAQVGKVVNIGQARDVTF